jgi:hypothetical protein
MGSIKAILGFVLNLFAPLTSWFKETSIQTKLIIIAVLVVNGIVVYQAISLRQAEAQVATLEARVTQMAVKSEVNLLDGKLLVLDEKLKTTETAIIVAQRRIDSLTVKPFVPKGALPDDLVKAFKSLPR